MIRGGTPGVVGKATTVVVDANAADGTVAIPGGTARAATPEPAAQRPVTARRKPRVRRSILLTALATGLLAWLYALELPEHGAPRPVGHSVDFWLDAPGKTQFSAREPVTAYFFLNGGGARGEAYMSLLNIAPSGVGSLVFRNRPLPAGRPFSIPGNPATLAHAHYRVVDQLLWLERGREDFHVVVTGRPLDPQQFLARYGDSTGKDPGSRIRYAAGQVPLLATRSLSVEAR